ncbi:MAG: pirin family protein [Chitinophagales bacterium]|nr:pirin family protein [Chitinophagales bacterium]MCZ2394649.1 pirin family protein [Chitinophagales bacterium]
MNIKNVEMIVSPPEPHFVGDGFRVHNFIPSVYRMEMKRMDPFILLDYNSKFYFPPSNYPKGVGVHPHRGFETVTIAYQGSVAHHDSHGGGGVIHKGDVQWMTAAKGVLHKEYHEKEFSKKGGDFQMVQLWVNLPAKYKMSKPKYQALSHEDFEKFLLDNKRGEVEVIAGEYRNAKGIASTFSPIHLYNIRLKKDSSLELSFPANFNTGLLIIEGKVAVNNESADLDNFVLMKNDGENFELKALEESLVLVLSGEPIGEPIAAHGPFVMNTFDEISKAFVDYNNGEFGYLDGSIE